MALKSPNICAIYLQAFLIRHAKTHEHKQHIPMQPTKIVGPRALNYESDANLTFPMAEQ